MTYTKLRHIETGKARDDCIQRDADGAFIPADPANIDWQAYQAWLAAGTAANAGQPVPRPSPVRQTEP